MKSSFLVVARNGESGNKFEEGSMLRALNFKDYLEELGNYQKVSIFQPSSPPGLKRIGSSWTR